MVACCLQSRSNDPLKGWPRKMFRRGMPTCKELWYWKMETTPGTFWLCHRPAYFGDANDRAPLVVSWPVCAILTKLLLQPCGAPVYSYYDKRQFHLTLDLMCDVGCWLHTFRCWLRLMEAFLQPNKPYSIRSQPSISMYFTAWWLLVPWFWKGKWMKGVASDFGRAPGSFVPGLFWATAL